MNQLVKNQVAANGLKKKVMSENVTADIIFETNRENQIDRYVVHKLNGEVESYDIIKGINTRNEVEVYSGMKEVLMGSLNRKDEVYQKLKTRFVLTVAIASIIVAGLITALMYVCQTK